MAPGSPGTTRPAMSTAPCTGRGSIPLAKAWPRSRAGDEDDSLRHHVLPPGALCSEPLLAQGLGGNTLAGKEEDRGSVLTLVYDSFTALSQIAILDVRTLALQARIQLRQAIPLTFHGSWWPA